MVRELNTEYGGLLYWAPWYAKINVFNSILYFDWLFGAGGGRVPSTLDTYTGANGANITVTSDTKPAIFATTGQQFYLSDEFRDPLGFNGDVLFRADLRDVRE